jgi:transposase
MSNSNYNFSKSDWEKTPRAVKNEFTRLEQRLKELEDKINQLLITVKKNSSNSSKPPSSDNPYKNKTTQGKTTKTQKRPGAKAGHKGKRQALLPPTNEVPIVPGKCTCGNNEFTHVEHYYTHQEIELLEISLDVIHFRLHEGHCTNCHKLVKAVVPKEHCTGFGPRLSAFIAENSGIQGNSRRMVQQFCQSFLKIDISIGAIQKVIDRASEAIKPHYDKIATIARASEVNNIDETSWKKNGVLHFLWVMVNNNVAFFKIHKERSKKAFLALIDDWKGILISDGYNVYQNWVQLRQTCLAHLIRDAKALAEHPKKEIKQFGEAIHLKLQQLCHMATEKPSEKKWNDFYSGFIDLIFDNCTQYFSNEAGKFARRLMREIDCLWIFLEVAGVEPTNNLAERSLRFGVLWRKRSQGTRCNKGNHWVERILSLKQTARIKNVQPFDILVDAMKSFFNEQKPNLEWI